MKVTRCKKCGQLVDLAYNKSCPICKTVLTPNNIVSTQSTEDEEKRLERKNKGADGFLIGAIIVILVLLGVVSTVLQTSKPELFNRNYISQKQKHTEKPVGTYENNESVNSWQLSQVFVKVKQNSITESYIQRYIETQDKYELGELTYTEEGYYTFDVYNAPYGTWEEWRLQGQALANDLQHYLKNNKVSGFEIITQAFGTTNTNSPSVYLPLN